MAETPPMIFAKQLGALRPVNGAAKRALAAIDGQVVVKLTKMRRNQRRRAFYWVMLDVAAEALTDATNQPWDAELLHNELKRRLELGDKWMTPSGAEVFKPRSTSDRAMDEQERARWTDRCANVLSHWLQVPIADLMDETRAREAA